MSPMNGRVEILIIDDDKQVVETLSALFKSKGFVPFGVYTGHKGLDLALNDVFSLIILDVSLPDMDSLELIKRIKGLKVSAPVIAMAEKNELNRAVELAYSGAENILAKPLNEEIAWLACFNALRHFQIETDNRKLKDSLASQYRIIGYSMVIEQFREKLKRIAMSSSRVLLIGEPGSGRKSAARFIHFSSARATRPFQPVNCVISSEGNSLTALHPGSDLFGYEKGAFVGANITSKGQFELADGGTLYLDEVGALKPDLQARLLRAIESNAVERLGSSNEIKVDVRVLAGSSIDLEAEVKAGRFREDLYFRLNVIPVVVPSLRSYPEDIPHLCRHFLDHAGFIRKRIENGTADYLKTLTWPGNLKQLRDTVIRAAGMAKGDTITIDNIKAAQSDTPSIAIKHVMQAESSSPSPEAGLFKSDLSHRDHIIDFERRLLAEVLALSDGNITKAAEMLQTDRGNLSKKIKKLGLKGS